MNFENNNKLLAGKVAVITGASKGIGAEISKVYAEHGADVAICFWKHISKAEELKKYIVSLGSNAEIFKCNVEDINSIKKTVVQISKRFKKIDILVNNAGILKQTPFEKINENEYDSILNTNLKGMFFFSQAVIPFLVRSKGTIVNIASVGGQKGGPKAPHYSASKAGVISLTKALAKIYASKEVRVNAISPGQIETNMLKKTIKGNSGKDDLLKNIPLGRIGSTKEVAYVALFLASEWSSYITGQSINVNGGEYLG